jgi:hypothetical protein
VNYLSRQPLWDGSAFSMHAEVYFPRSTTSNFWSSRTVFRRDLGVPGALL